MGEDEVGIVASELVRLRHNIDTYQRAERPVVDWEQEVNWGTFFTMTQMGFLKKKRREGR